MFAPRREKETVEFYHPTTGVRFQMANPLAAVTRQPVCFVIADDSILKRDRAAFPRESPNVFQYLEFADFVKPITKPSAFWFFWVVFEAPSQDSP